VSFSTRRAPELAPDVKGGERMDSSNLNAALGLLESAGLELRTLLALAVGFVVLSSAVLIAGRTLRERARSSRRRV
jgi:hypothetical protein